MSLAQPVFAQSNKSAEGNPLIPDAMLNLKMMY